MARLLAFPQITQLGLENFRAFQHEPSIEVAPLTFLVGPNSGGKSSLFSAVLLLAQSLSWGAWPPRNPWPQWSGTHVDLGSFKDAVYAHHRDSTMKVRVRIPLFYYGHLFPPPRARAKNQVDYNFEFCGRNGPAGSEFRAVTITDVTSGTGVTLRSSTIRNRPAIQLLIPGLPGRPRLLGRALRPPSRHRPFAELSEQVGPLLERSRQRLGATKAAIKRLVGAADAFDLLHLLPNAQRVASARSGPERTYRRAEGPSSRPWDSEPPAIIGGVDLSALPPSARRSRLAMSRYGRLNPRRIIRTTATMNATLAKLGIAKSIKWSDISPYHSIIKLSDKETGVWCNLVDVGYGASQIIPVIQACLAPELSPLFVEQPEIHLHPHAQAAVAELLATTSKTRQVVIETHSVHIINQARIMVAKHNLRPADVVINYVHRDTKGSHVETIRIDEAGEFDKPWPHGFFDERFEESLTLLKLRAAREGQQ